MNTKFLKEIDFSLNERIVQFMEKTELRPVDLVKSGVSNQQYISNVCKNIRTPNVNFITRLLFSYPNLRWQWLLGGEGEMLKDKNYTTSEAILDIVNEEAECQNPKCVKKIAALKDDLLEAGKLIIQLQSELLANSKKESLSVHQAQYGEDAKRAKRS